MKKLLFIAFIWIVEAVGAQPSIQWQKTFGGSDFDEAYSIKQTVDGGFIVAGSTISNDGDVFGNQGGEDFWILEFDTTGLIQWKKSIGGSNNEIPHCIQQTSDNGYIIVGFSESNNGDVTNNYGNKDVWIVKMNISGIIEWEKNYGGSEWDEAHSIQQTSDGGYVFAGFTQSSGGDISENHGLLDFWVVKLNNIGVIEWEKTFGGSNEDKANSIKKTIDGGYIIVGNTKSIDGDVLENQGNVDYWIIKINDVGELEWQKTLGGQAADSAEDILQLEDGGYMVVGHSGSNNTGNVSGHHGSFDAWVVKLSNTGDLQWQKALGGSNADYGRSILQASDGTYVIAGSTKSNDGDIMQNQGNSDAWLLKLNDFGDLIWQKTLGGSNAETFFDLEQTIGGGYILAGYSWSNDGDVSGVQGYNDFWIVKLTPESTPTTSPQTQPLEIYPNPATQSITIQVSEPETTLRVTLTDPMGRELRRKSIPNGGTLALEGLADGWYLLSATSPSGQVFFGKVWKQG
jgi:hypothetical protein